MAAETGSITISIRKLLAMQGWSRRLPDAIRRRNAGTALLPDRGDCVAVPLGPAAGFRRDAAGLPAARAVDRGGARIRLHGDGGAALLGRSRTRTPWCAYARALAAAFRFIRDPAQRDDVVRTIVETTGFPEANARLTLALFFDPERKVLPQRGEIDMKGMATAIAFMGEPASSKTPLPPPERFVDLQYLRAAGVE